ncbi:phytanoyl-CoA dioxygenase family protein [Stappia sp. F7233]|uniref:Phytanoyl-CoA dioxygenase family protein n=1 Tax=Stappia albiluteola TaxID=2758565 RepID=A0A839A987_9HYPH|nr:phytanoyl-CoA dioxygenase family protein [Stappia albiluteola]MBA5775911.1 phytanoyl-CoA dioxygenase family protein [Stappia albiluteola]
MIRTPTLTDQQIADFDRDGFVHVPGAFSPEEMATIEAWAKEVTSAPEVPGRQWVYHEKSRIDGADLINRIEKIAPFHDGFRAIATALGKVAGQAFGEEAVLFKEKINFKMPGGGGFEPHQDAQAGWNVYASNFVNVMLCIDEATVENGCLEVTAGHHRRGLLRGMEPLREEDMVGMEFVHCPTRPGDLVLFDAYCPHRSAPNPTANTRRMYFATYNKASEGDHFDRYHADKHRNYPPDIEREAGRSYVYKV